MFLHFDGTVVTQATMQEYLNSLPLKAESEEAQNVHKLFFQQILSKNPILLAPGNLPLVKQALQYIHDVATKQPELEIVKTEDLPLLQQCIDLLLTLK